MGRSTSRFTGGQGGTRYCYSLNGATRSWNSCSVPNASSRPEPNRLFRIASDNLAYECRSFRVRPGEKYILVGTTGPMPSSQYVRALEMNCEGVCGLMLNLPEALTLDWEETLRHLGLQQSRTVEVWPAGLAPVVWDGDGYGEWMETDIPCLGILSDHPLATLNVSIETDRNGVFELASVDSGEPVFLELPRLPVGIYGMHVSAQNMAGGTSGQLGELDILIRILEERPQSQVISPIGTTFRFRWSRHHPPLSNYGKDRLTYPFRVLTVAVPKLVSRSPEQMMGPRPLVSPSLLFLCHSKRMTGGTTLMCTSSPEPKLRTPTT